MPGKPLVLVALPAAGCSGSHLGLIPETPFPYRVRPFTGPVSTELPAVTAGGTVTFTSEIPWPGAPAHRLRTLYYGPLSPVVQQPTGKER
ncbi:hypothetical protein [Amycolatopsis rifamycinica]|uniref:Uncharacterized protein n=1 Tax=Amycolatopsis rifamycinica TaxID=287986 RepID=A0A066U3L4_9PSEU|nr:hypothetical protein [Amycolatopsis rifamycinica]KDN21660.1 hypothetical protein DV20_14385 [Amycolatopsis rifamycinica]